MPDLPYIADSEPAQCPVCKRMRPYGELRRMWRLPLFILRLAHMHPQEEADWLYCRRCAFSQNVCALLLAALAVFVCSFGSAHWLAIGWLAGALVGLLVGSVLYLRWRMRSRKIK